MSDQPFWRKPGESAADWHARLAGMDPLCLSCHLRQRRTVWLDMARDVLRKQRRTERPRREDRR